MSDEAREQMTTTPEAGAAKPDGGAPDSDLEAFKSLGNVPQSTARNPSETDPIRSEGAAPVQDEDERAEDESESESEAKTHGEKTAEGIAKAKTEKAEAEKAEEFRALRRAGMTDKSIALLSDDARKAMLSEIQPHLEKQDRKWAELKSELEAARKGGATDSPKAPAKGAKNDDDDNSDDNNDDDDASTTEAVSDPSDPSAPADEDGVIGLIDDGFDPEAGKKIKAAIVSRDKRIRQAAKAMEESARQRAKLAFQNHALQTLLIERDVQAEYPALTGEVRKAVYAEMEKINERWGLGKKSLGNRELISTIMREACRIILGDPQNEAARAKQASENKRQRDGLPDPARNGRGSLTSASKVDPDYAAFVGVTRAYQKGQPSLADEEISRILS